MPIARRLLPHEIIAHAERTGQYCRFAAEESCGRTHPTSSWEEAVELAESFREEPVPA